MEDIVERILSFAVPLIPGFILGFFLGRLAKKTLGTALMIAGGIAVVLFLVAHFGGDISVVTDWLKVGSAWAGEQLTGVGQYLAAIVPPIAALGIGFKFGMGRRSG